MYGRLYVGEFFQIRPLPPFRLTPGRLGPHNTLKHHTYSSDPKAGGGLHLDKRDPRLAGQGTLSDAGSAAGTTTDRCNVAPHKPPRVPHDPVLFAVRESGAWWMDSAPAGARGVREALAAFLWNSCSYSSPSRAFSRRPRSHLRPRRSFVPSAAAQRGDAARAVRPRCDRPAPYIFPRPGPFGRDAWAGLAVLG